MSRLRNGLLAALGVLVVAVVLWGVLAVPAGNNEADQSASTAGTNASSADPSAPASSVVTSPSTPIEPGDVNVQPEVQQAFDAGDVAPVILKLDVAPTGDDDQRVSQIRVARDRLLAELPAGSWSQVKDVGTLPYLALTLDSAGFEATRQSGQVQVIGYDDQTWVPIAETKSSSSIAPSSISSTATMGAVSAWAAGWKGAGATVAVIDTGVETSHPYLTRDGTPKTIAEACFASVSGARKSMCPNGVSMLTTSAPVVGSAKPCPSTVDGCKHGTHVAGIAVGGDGVAIPSGVAPEANLIAINAFTYTSSGASASTSDINNALQWLYYNRARFPGLTSVNMSIGDSSKNLGYCDTDSTKTYIDQLLRVGIATVIAAGNDGWMNAVSSPGCISSAVTVGAVDGTPDQTTSYSNDGPQVDLMAPGSGITSSILGSQMGVLSGTSMATPAVAGAFAVLHQATPALTLARLRDSGYVVNASGYSIPSVRLSDAASIYPSPVQSLAVATDTGQATIRWQPPTDPGSTSVYRYTVTATATGTSCTTATLSCTISGLTTGSFYSFVIRAESSTGLGAPKTTLATRIVTSSSITSNGSPTFNSVSPVRLSDTRTTIDGGATVDSQQVGLGKLGGGGVDVVPIAGRGGVPATGAGAVALNVTVISPTVGGFLTLYPSGSPRPNASNINFVAGAIVPNMVIAKLGTDGSIAVFNSQGLIDVAIDVVGWFPVSGGYGPLNPARIVETRSGQGYTTIDGRSQGGGALGGSQSISVPVLGRGGVPASKVTAVAINVTAVEAGAESYLTVFPGGTSRPNASNLNFRGGQTIANMVIAKVGANGTISIYNNSGSVNVVVDVVGWFSSTSQLTSLSPARLVESRALETVDGRQQNIGGIWSGQTLSIEVAGRGGVPATGARAVALNVTVVGSTGAGYLTAFASGGSVPGASNLNFVAGQTVANMVIAEIGPDGNVSLLNSNGWTPVAVDVVGWFPT